MKTAHIVGSGKDILREFPRDGIERLEVSVLSADLRLERGAGSLIRVTAGGGDKPDRLSFVIEGVLLRIEEAPDADRPLESLAITAPPGLDFIELRGQSGTINCEGIDADLSIETASGDVGLHDVVGDCSVKSSSGGIEASSGGSISASTASGNMHISEVRGGVVAREMVLRQAHGHN
ncbi:MAG: DUF4097 family beta strand repeat-containing protein, partial [Spirochaetota bacterium]